MLNESESVSIALVEKNKKEKNLGHESRTMDEVDLSRNSQNSVDSCSPSEGAHHIRMSHKNDPPRLGSDFKGYLDDRRVSS